MSGRLVFVSLSMSAVFLVFAVFPFSKCSGKDEQERTHLVYKFIEGDVQKYRLVTESDQRQDVGPFQRSVRELTFSQRVVEVIDGVASLEIIYESLRVDVQAGPMSFSYDSSAASNNIDDLQKKMYEALLGRPCRVRIDASGEVLDVSGFDAPFDEIESELKDKPFARPIIEAQRASFGNEGMKETFASTFLRLPDRELTDGSKWSFQQDMNHPIGVLLVRSSNRLASFENVQGYRCARIEQTSTADLIEPKAANFMGAVFEHSLESATMKATHHVAIDPGLLLRSESEIHMTLRVTPKFMNGQRPDPFMPSSIGVTTVTKVLLERV